MDLSFIIRSTIGEELDQLPYVPEHIKYEKLTGAECAFVYGIHNTSFQEGNRRIIFKDKFCFGKHVVCQLQFSRKKDFRRQLVQLINTHHERFPISISLIFKSPIPLCQNTAM